MSNGVSELFSLKNSSILLEFAKPIILTLVLAAELYSSLSVIISDSCFFIASSSSDVALMANFAKLISREASDL